MSVSDQSSKASPRRAPAPLSADALRWKCPDEAFDFETTKTVEPLAGIVGQDSAIEALRFGLKTRAPGQNIFVRGLTGSGRMALIERVLQDLDVNGGERRDHAYVHNFSAPERPRLISLPPGQARMLRRRVQRFAEFVRQGLPEALNAEPVRARQDAIKKREAEKVETMTAPFQKSLEEAGLALVSVNMGGNAQAAIFPVVEGKPTAPEEFEGLHEEGKITDERFADWREKRDGFAKELSELGKKIAEIRVGSMRSLDSVIEDSARSILEEQVATVRATFADSGIEEFLDEAISDVIENVVGSPEPEMASVLRLLDVNVVLCHTKQSGAPVVLENMPTLSNLLGTVDREWTAQGPAPSSYRMIRAGSILRADGGYLVLDANDLLSEPGAWKMLVRTLRTGCLEIVPNDSGISLFQQSVKPEPIPVRFRVILLGDARTYYLLDANDPEFALQFKVLADFDNVIERNEEGLMHYAGIIARMVEDENLPDFHRGAIAALAEHGVRIAASGGMLTTRFTRIADISREAAFLAHERDGDAAIVQRSDVEGTIQRTKRRADLPSRRFRKHLREGTIHVQTQGEAIGQINGLAVIHSGPITYGFPARITATIGPGNAGIIDIEGRAALSGSIHTKGVQILGGLVRHLLQTDHPLAFSASLAFEQSYGGIDGDSASGAEICCLLSALSDVPLRQDLAMTGAIDQFGRIQAIGGVNEKIEGFYDTCMDAGLTGTQGVLIPKSNADDLMLRPDVAEACAQGKFSIHAVDSIYQALELFTGMPAGELDEYDEYPEDSLLAIAVGQALHYWERTLQNPAQLLAALHQQQQDEALAAESGEESGDEGTEEEEVAAEA